MSFRITGLNPAQFRHLYGLSDEKLKAAGARRCISDAKSGFPDRIELRDLEPGETAILLNFTHQPASTPYRASHAIFIREGAEHSYEGIGVIPLSLQIRTISLRAFSTAGEMIDADLVDGMEIQGLIEHFFRNPSVDYLQAHYAKYGCYAARIDRI